MEFNQILFKATSLNPLTLINSQQNKLRFEIVDVIGGNDLVSAYFKISYKTSARNTTETILEDWTVFTKSQTAPVFSYEFTPNYTISDTSIKELQLEIKGVDVDGNEYYITPIKSLAFEV